MSSYIDNDKNLYTCINTGNSLNILTKFLHNKSPIVSVGHIRKTDGFFGMYRGLGARLTGGIVGSFVTNYVSMVSALKYYWHDLIEDE